MKATEAVLIGVAVIALASCASRALPGSQDATLAHEVRRATEVFKDVSAATTAGYARFLGCVSYAGESSRRAGRTRRSRQARRSAVREGARDRPPGSR